MAAKLLGVLGLGILVAAAAGCGGGGLQRKFDDLAAEHEELQRQKTQMESDFLACKARCEGLERDRRARPAATPVEIPSELRGQVDIRRRGNDTVIDLPSDVFFASGSSTLSPASERAMAHVADYIRRSHPQGMIRVEGHSDADPIRRTKSRFHCNWELSFERAHAVAHHLIEKGKLDPRRVVCEAFGEFHPVDPRDKSKNRRVEIVIAKP